MPRKPDYFSNLRLSKIDKQIAETERRDRKRWERERKRARREAAEVERRRKRREQSFEKSLNVTSGKPRRHGERSSLGGCVFPLMLLGSKARKEERLRLMTEREEENFRRLEAIRDLQRLDHAEFEEYIALIYRKMGFEARLRGKSTASDDGIDIEARKDGQYVVIQCKRYSSTIGAPMIREFYGAVVSEGAHKGVFVTTSAFSEPAREWAVGKSIELIGSQEITEWQKMLKIGPFQEDKNTDPISDLPEARQSDPLSGHVAAKKGMTGLQVTVLILLTAMATAVCGCAGLAALGAWTGGQLPGGG